MREVPRTNASIATSGSRLPCVPRKPSLNLGRGTSPRRRRSSLGGCVALSMRQSMMFAPLPINDVCATGPVHAPINDVCATAHSFHLASLPQHGRACIPIRPTTASTLAANPEVRGLIESFQDKAHAKSNVGVIADFAGAQGISFSPTRGEA